MSIKNYGFVKPRITSDQYLLGALKRNVLVPDGNWYKYLPLYEPQFGKGWDTYGCTVWGTQNAIETILKRLEGKEYNFSERFTYILADITPPGADPHHVSEVIRKTGLIDNSRLPFTKSYKEFLKPKPMTQEYIDEGHDWLTRYGFGHEWIITLKTKTKDKLPIIKEHLKYSPIGISVTAWEKNNKGEYISNGKPNTHWCIAFRVDEEDRIWVFDSYDQSVKVLAREHNIEFAKMYTITPLAEIEQTLSLLEKLARLIKSFLGMLPPDLPVEKIDEYMEVKEEIKESPRERLYKAAVESLGKEMSPIDIAPDELACGESVCNVIRLVYPDFPMLPYTPDLADYLKKDKRFKGTLDPDPGNIIISPTATSTRRGHVGIHLGNGRIASNTSENGLWEDNLSIDSWVKTYRTKNKLPIIYFEPIG